MIDLDEPLVLAGEGLRPSLVATRERSITQPQALELYRRHAAAAALRWWSVHESLWANVTVFDRAAPMLQLVDVRRRHARFGSPIGRRTSSGDRPNPLEGGRVRIRPSERT